MEQASHETGTEFYEEVATLLESELGQHPHRSDLRFKLLEVYAATHRKDAFLREANNHLERETGAPGHDPYRLRILQLGRRLCPDDPTFAGEDEDSESAPEDNAVATAANARRFYESLDAERLGQQQVQIQQAHDQLRKNPDFWRELRQLANDRIRPGARLAYAERLSQYLGGAQIFVRNDVDRSLDEASIINAIGQALIARELGREKLFAAAAGIGHIEAVTQIARHFDLKLALFATERDQVQQGSRLSRISLDKVEIQYVADAPGGSRSEGQRLALSAALEDPNSFYLSPVDAGPHPYPVIVQDLLSMAGRELRLEIHSVAGHLPSALIVSDADSMNAVGYLQAFLSTKTMELTCVQSGAPHRHGRDRLAREHGWLHASGRVRYTSVADEVARFLALNCPIDSVPKLRLSGGEVLAETMRQARQLDVSGSVVAVLPVAPPLATIS